MVVDVVNERHPKVRTQPPENAVPNVGNPYCTAGEEIERGAVWTGFPGQMVASGPSCDETGGGSRGGETKSTRSSKRTHDDPWVMPRRKGVGERRKRSSMLLSKAEPCSIRIQGIINHFGTAPKR